MTNSPSTCQCPHDPPEEALTDCALANGVSLIGKFDGEFAGHSSTYAGTGTVRYVVAPAKRALPICPRA